MTTLPQLLPLVTISDNGHPIKVVDAIDESTQKAYMRCIMDDRGGVYSAINLTAERRQPFLVAIQDIIDGWGISNNPSQALVLGCAGCAIPRYLLSTFSSIRVVGVEISSQLVSIAQKYFLDGMAIDRLSLINSDAAAYCKCQALSSRFDLIVSDLFDGHCVLENIYSSDFVSNIRIMMHNDKSLFIANLSGIGNDSLKRIVKCYQESFYGTHVIRDRKRIYLIAYPSHSAATKELSSVISKYSQEFEGKDTFV